MLFVVMAKTRMGQGGQPKEIRSSILEYYYYGLDVSPQKHVLETIFKATMLGGVAYWNVFRRMPIMIGLQAVSLIFCFLSPMEYLLPSYDAESWPLPEAT